MDQTFIYNTGEEGCAKIYLFAFNIYITPQKCEVFAKVFDPPKRFKICYIFMKRKPKVAFSVFHFVLDVDQGIH